MSFWQLDHVAIKGVSLCVPSSRIQNEDFPFFTPQEAHNFENSVGIKERRIALPDVCASDLALQAAEKLLAELSWKKTSIDILIFESVTPDYRTPPTSCLLQERLGLSQSCFTLDVPMGCCGTLYALILGGNLLSENNRRALLLIGDTAQRMGSLKDKSRAALFGDGATAIALEYQEQSTNKIIAQMYSYGHGAKALMTPDGGYRRPISERSFIEHNFGNGIIRSPYDALINGMDVLSFAISKPPKTSLLFLEKFHIDKDKDIDYFLIHQANKLIIDRFTKKLAIPSERVISNLDRYGNLGAASIPSLMVDPMRHILSKGKHRLFLTAFGLGLTWGHIYIETENLTLPPIEIFDDRYKARDLLSIEKEIN